MIFNSLTFVVFFALVMGAYWSLRSWDTRKNLLLVASYLFYGAANPPFLILLFVTTVADYWVSRRLEKSARRGARIAWLVFSLVSNLGMLVFFKYGNFLLENTHWLLERFGVVYQSPHLDLILPVGISFYTFQTLSYILDVYRRQAPPAPSLRDFALYVSFFPHLVAGPIVRSVDLLPQMSAPPVLRQGQIGWGLYLMTLGLFQKAVLADTLLAGPAEAVFKHAGLLAGPDAWVGVLAFSGQIFFDFAGYSTCAVGAALCLGFSLVDNFRAPYAALGFSDFWRRWHISLSRFLRDYLYIPLGGNRSGAVRAAINVVLVMLIGGLWHGAAWTFVIWGALHGLFLVLERIVCWIFRRATWTDHAAVKALVMALTFLGVTLAWVFFRAANFDAAMRLLAAMFGALPFAGDAIFSTREIVQVLGVMIGLMLVHWRMQGVAIEGFVSRQPRWLTTTGWALMATALIFNQGNGNAFIYFQF